MDDEVDEHHRGRDKISLDPDAPSSDDDDLDDEEAVMDIDADAESEDSEDSDESDSETSEGEGAKGGKAKPRADRSEGGAESASDEDEAALYKAMKAQQKKLNSRAPTRARRDDSDTDDASDSDSEDRGAGVRGARKADFYGDDEVDHEGASDEDERVEEEREALRLQRVAADEMDAADFGLEDESDDDEEEDDRATPLGAKAKALAGGAGKKPSAKKEKKEKKEKREKKALGAAVESLGADPSLAGSLASDVVASDAPELIALTKELTRNLDEVRCSVEPVIAAARAGDLATAEGVSYLDAKHLLMLSYCVNIVFYLLLKAEGRPVRDHPVVLRLVEIRTYLEKLRPVDRKLRYQIDKLVKMADRPSEERAAEEEDPLAFRPNPDALVSKVDEDAEEGGAGGAYRPPKMLPTAMEGEFEEGGEEQQGEAQGKGGEEARQQVRAHQGTRSVRGADGFLFFPLLFGFEPPRGAPTRPERNPDSTTCAARFLVLRPLSSACYSMETAGDHFFSRHRAHVPDLGQGTVQIP
jgi:U3 small nucleolar RNA-associated protein 3